jgi:5-methylcytosine-specific restriction endonuclease McrA
MFADLKARPDKPERLDFYGSARWQRLRKMKLANNPICEVCKRKPAQHVHHLSKAREDETLRFIMENLQSICIWCHAKETQRETTASRIKKSGGGCKAS